uniref:MATH domain-containing protein n=1 Tax=Brassica campestris TaxID=3711 RepID=M4CKG6_BRACM
MWSQNPSFRFLYVYPKGDLHADNHLSVYLRVANPKSLQIGWKRNVSFYFVVLNHRNRERCISANVESKVFDAENPAWGFSKLFPLSQLKEERFMGKESVIIDVCVNVIEAVDGESKYVPEKETMDINGFQVSASLSKLKDVSLEKKKSDDADGSRVQQLEESVENLETMVSDLKAKLDEEKAKSSSDEFLLVNAQIINVRCSSSVWSNLDSNPEKQSRALFMASKAE